jgi:hypothetical protein
MSAAPMIVTYKGIKLWPLGATRVHPTEHLPAAWRYDKPK